MINPNRFPSVYDELISYYPDYYRGIREMKAILQAQGAIADGIVEAIDKMLDDCFVVSASAEMIDRLEAFLEITPRTSNLEERRQTILSYLVGFGKISASKLKSLLSIYTDGECTITFQSGDPSGNNLLKIVVPRGSFHIFSQYDILRLLSQRLPSHLRFGVEVVYSEKAPLLFGITTAYISEVDIPSVEEDVSLIVYYSDELDDILVDELGNILVD